jgi:hypothetical protein
MVYVVDYLPEEMQVLFDQPIVVGMSEPDPEEVRYILKLNRWQSLINDQTAAECLSLLLGMRIPTAKNRKVNFKYSDKLIVFLLQQEEEEVWSKKIIVSYYKFVYVHMRPLSEVAI